MYLGIDLGTSGLKAVLIDEGGTLIGLATVALNVSQPQLGWSEQDPEDWWQALVQASKMLAAEHSALASADKCTVPR